MMGSNISKSALTGDTLDDQRSFNPDQLLDALLATLHLKNDAQLCRVLNVGPPMISKIRHRRLPIGAPLLIRMHEESKLSIAELRAMMGDHREKFGVSDAPRRE
ncbi:hypothetical protein [Glaciimonas immobilis]|uniref:XRE family transcriptional regulator n=1 Tax=Glaciimonas immobilis TaxID=728004 RepID=A0A840RUW9_9BURK|nr:hypothetical protein [Glaciimonas immobilis]KAF3999789.1 hypothetical protein HAV38_00940 [Glaciimonas immobilis]MBB5200259.1 hypothetical protein [Glaciimonas immobilis]